MGTRSCIMIKVRPSDMGKALTFDESKLPIKLEDWKSIDPLTGKVWRDETGSNLCKPVSIGDTYVGIYCHWDGYPEGVGAALQESFNDYDKALNLIVGGSCSSVGSDTIKHYANRQGESWDGIQPLQGKTQKSVYERCGWAEYAYLYDEERGGWVYKNLCESGCDKRGFEKY